MRLLSILSILYSLAFTLDCQANESYIKVTKRCEDDAKEESFVIKNNGVVVVTSPLFQNEKTRVLEYCLPQNPTNQYTLELRDSYGNSWDEDSWLSIQGIYDNFFFKNLMIKGSLETYILSTYYAIEKTASWMLTNGTVDGSWKDYYYDETEWTTYTSGAPHSTTGTQYFRHSFVGIADQAAYELRLKYRYGVVVYINGVEVYRDNISSGIIVSTTIASGSYSSSTYRGIIRPGLEVTSAESMLSIELHVMNLVDPYPLDLEAFMATMAPSEMDTKCFILANPITLSIVGSTSSPSALRDWDKTSRYSRSFDNKVQTLMMVVDGSVPFVNSLRMWPYTKPSYGPKNYVFAGSNDGTTFNTIVDVTGQMYQSNMMSYVYGIFNAGLYNRYRLAVTSSSDIKFGFGELHPMVCSISVPTEILYDKTSYFFYAIHQTVRVAPISSEFTNCQIQPALPSGLSMKSGNCVVEGIATVALDNTEFTVTSASISRTFTGKFHLEVSACATGTMMKIVRIYQENASREYFMITDAITNDVVLSVAADDGQVSNESVIKLICLSGTRFRITLGGETAYWEAQSYLYVKAIVGNDDVVLHRARLENNLNLSTELYFFSYFHVPALSQWHYKMGSIPEGWTDSQTDGWLTGSIGSFAASTNQIQLYKLTFTVDSLTGTAGFVMMLKYTYGCVVYMNNHLAFNRGVTLPLTASSMSSTSYSDLMYHQISLPIRSINRVENSVVDFLRVGSNTIAIAVIAKTASQTASTFDFALHLMGDAVESRVLGDWSVSTNNIKDSAADAFRMNHKKPIYYNSCATNYAQITFADDRREWVSSVIVQLAYEQVSKHPRQFVLKASNGDSQWVTLKTVSSMEWSQKGQRKRIWIQNSNTYNMYRFENFATGDTTDCAWQLGLLDLVADDMAVEVPALSYERHVSIYKGVEMAEMYTNSDRYEDFSILPPLPTGISLDSNTGMISGTATIETAAKEYTVSATKYNGETMTAEFTMDVEICKGTKSLMTTVIRTDNAPESAYYKLWRGNTVNSTLVQSNTAFHMTSSLEYLDFCLPHDIYTLELFSSTRSGWNNPAGFYLTVDVGEIVYEMGQVSVGMSSVTTRFSSFLPFQMVHDEWKVYKSDIVVSGNWNKIAFDDASWSSVKAAGIGSADSMTVYLRRTIVITDMTDYHVLNVRMKYSGGVVAYFNGRKVARFNLEENFNSTSSALVKNGDTIYSKFHMILNMVGAVSGKNVMSFEIHRHSGESSTTPVMFDATGVFGVNDCSIVLDSFMNFSATEMLDEDLVNIFDLSPITFATMTNILHAKVEWMVKNLEGSTFNSYAWQTPFARTSWGFSLYGRSIIPVSEEDNDFTSMAAFMNQDSGAMVRNAWSVPVGVASYRQFRYVLDDTSSSTLTLSDHFFQFCKSVGGSCPGVSDYPSVGEGMLSPSSCPYGYRGFSYRNCESGVLSEVKYDKCEHKLPTNLKYSLSRYTFVRDVMMKIDAPVHSNIITRFYVDGGMFPEGLKINNVTGEISGIPRVDSLLTIYTIFGANDEGITSTEITITVRIGECKAEGIFQRTPVGSVAVYDCAMDGNYVGTRKRGCQLGAENGVWQQGSGVCVSIVTIIFVILVAVIVIAFVVVLIVRTSRRTRSMGGVKATKKRTTKKVIEKKTIIV